MKIKTKARKWGDSIAIIVPSRVVKAQKIRPDDQVVVELEEPVLAEDVFGIAESWDRDVQDVKNEMRRGWE